MNAILLMRVGWPSFLGACVLEAILFALVDPLELHWAGHALGWSRQSVYTIAFFVLWLVCALTCLLTAYLSVAEAPSPADADGTA
jgi:hypothetical protein